VTRLTAELLTPAQVVQHWPTLKPWYDASCASCEITRDLMVGDDVLRMAQRYECHVFGFFSDGVLQFTMAIQFADANGKKVAYIIGMGGQNMRAFLASYWPYIQDWMKNNGAAAVYTEAGDRNARIYMKKYGFDKSTVKLGKSLGD
jgi:hypothetical protein